jgi:hypothetical protein
LAAATVVSSSAAVSLADQPSTSRRISTARGRGGRCWMATMKASSMVSLAASAASGSLLAGGQALQQPVWVGLQPGHLGGAGRVHPPRPTRQLVQAGVGGDPVEPGPQARAAGEAAAPAPGPQQRLLHQVLGVLEGAEHAVAVQMELAPVALGQRGKARLVPPRAAARSARASSAPSLVWAPLIRRSSVACDPSGAGR